MLSSAIDFSEFMSKVEGHTGREIITLADQEATAAERACFRHRDAESREIAQHYVLLLRMWCSICATAF